jgi:23S rRNA (cytidine1920-2'-O)/16S rRNA (cytidine1409-2'-O)-methyltransferase
LLVARGLVASRTLAQALILAGQVRTGPDAVVAKPSQMLLPDAFLQIAQPPRFVGRGGEKLDAFIEKFAIDARGMHALDIGASTGGFTDCLLQRGAAHVTCVDVGHGQLHAKLRSDQRVTNLEKINARELEKISLPRDNYDLVVIDVSFISLTKILPPAWARVREGGKLIALVKPQFEASKAEASAGRGIIRDAAIQQRVVETIKNFAAANLPGTKLFGEMESPITGGDGNREFLVGWSKDL